MGDPEVDAVVIATPNALHAPQAIAFLEAGQHVLVEKPMAMTAAEGELMVAAAEGSGAGLMVAHCWRFHPDVRALRERIAAGELGEVVKTRGYGVHVRWGPSGWFTQRQLAGGGALADMGVHAIDTARFLLGEPSPAGVSAAIGTRYGTTTSTTTRSCSSAGTTAPTRSSSRDGGSPMPPAWRPTPRFTARTGYARVFAFTEPPTDTYEHCPQSMYTTQMSEFIAADREGRQPSPSGEDGLVVMRVLDEAYRSAEAAR